MKSTSSLNGSVLHNALEMLENIIISTYANFKSLHLLVIISIITLGFFQTSCIINAQEPVQKIRIDLTPLETGSVATQFDFVLDKSSKFEDSRVVKAFWLTRLKAHVVDTIKTGNKKLSEAQKTIVKNQLTIDSLQASIISINTDLATINSEKNSMKLFGVLIHKNIYNTIIWLIISGLVVLLVILSVLFKRSNSVTTQAKTDLEELKEEYETHRKRALDREAQLSRKHLDEIIKLKK